jgi:hypothetical protein
VEEKMIIFDILQMVPNTPNIQNINLSIQIHVPVQYTCADSCLNKIAAVWFYLFIVPQRWRQFIGACISSVARHMWVNHMG